MKSPLIILTLSLAICLLFSCSNLELIHPEPTFVSTFSGSGSSIGYDIEKSSDSTWIIVGYDNYNGRTDLVVWEISYEGEYDYEVNTLTTGLAGSNGRGRPHIVKTEENRFFVAGELKGSTSKNFFTTIDERLEIKSSPNSVGEGDLFSVFKRQDNSLCLASGFKRNSNKASGNLSIISSSLIVLGESTIVDNSATSSYGIYDKQYGANSIIYSEAGEVIILSEGKGNATNDRLDLILQRVSTTSDIVLESTEVIDIDSLDYGVKLLTADENNFFVCGYTSNSSRRTYPFVRRYNNSFNELGRYNHNAGLISGDVVINNAIKTMDGGLLLFGYSENDGKNPYLLKLDSKLKFEWEQKSLGEEGIDEEFYGARQLEGGGYIFVGSKGPEANKNIHVVQLNGEGEGFFN